MKKQQIVIFLLVGAMLFSVVGTAVLLLAQGNGNDSTDDTADLFSSECPELPAAEGALETPEVTTVEGDVTEVQTEDLETGTGKAVKPGDTLTVHYHGWRADDGCVFDSSYLRGETATFPLSGVIVGWQEGMVGMKAGGTRKLIIPSDKAYGVTGAAPLIGPDQDLVFVVELQKVE